MSAVDPLERGGDVPPVLHEAEADAAQPAVDLVVKALRALGDTPEEIARKLRGLGVKGIPHRAEACPIYIWLDHAVCCEAPPDTTIEIDSVTPMTIALNSTRVGEAAAWAAITPPAPVSGFISLFDAGRFPELDARSET